MFHVENAIKIYENSFNEVNDKYKDVLYIWKASILLNMEEYKKALIYANFAIDLNPENIGYYDIRAKILYSLKDYENAIKDYTVLIENNPDNVNFLIDRARLKYYNKDLQGAIEDFSKVLEKDNNKYDIYCELATSKYEMKDFNGAIAVCTTYLEKNNKDSNAYYCRGLSKFCLQDYKGAIEDYSKAIELCSENYLYYFERGKTKTCVKDYRGAFVDCTAAIKLKPDYYGCYFERAIIYYYLGNKNLAINDINFAINLMKNSDINNYYTDGEILSYKAFWLFEEDKNKALDFLIEVQKNCKKDKDKLYVVISYIFFGFENYKKSLKYADMAILNNRNNAQAYYRKKCVLEALGRKEEARKCYEQALKLGYQE